MNLVGEFVTLTLGAEPELRQHSPNTTISGLPATESRTSGICDETVAVQPDQQAGFNLAVSGTLNDLCTPAAALATSVITRLHTSPPQRANTRGSVAVLDPCTTVSGAGATTVLGAQPDIPASLDSLYTCSWTSRNLSLSVEFTLGEDPKNDTVFGVPTPVALAGVPAAYRETATSGPPSCHIRWPVRPDQGRYQIADVSLSDARAGATSTTMLCAKATTAAAVVAASLAKS